MAVRAERHAVDTAGVSLEGEGSWPVAASQTFTVPSSPAGGEALAVGAKRHAVDIAGVPLRVSISWPVRGVPDLHRLVPAAEARRWPSGLNATLLTQSVCR